ncbi:MAG: DUF1553 domain-containing protein [Aureliella sp.]
MFVLIMRRFYTAMAGLCKTLFIALTKMAAVLGPTNQLLGVVSSMYKTPLSICSLLLLANLACGDELDFNRDIRPILSDNCYFCHGPDGENRKGGLRLDVRDDAIGIIESGDLLERICEQDEDIVMPPPASNLSLSSDEKRILKQWIEQGAEYAGHWAFEKLPLQVAVPTVKSDWPRQKLDAFVLTKMQEHGLTPNSTADPLRWLRRVTLDLTGLPPTQQSIEHFEAILKSQPTVAYEQQVDHLLESPSFGEHMAVAWLDAARYADSYGYQSDKLNTQWPYRDWVVKALNENLPYDDFLTWQLAGDLLDTPTRDQLVATAFNRVHRLNNEGGAVFEEWRLENVADRVHTFGTAVLGLTMECCRCHDHKYDPIPMREYYALSAYFNSIDESGVYDRTQKVPCPSILLPTSEQSCAIESARTAMQASAKKYERVVSEAQARYREWQPKESFDPSRIPDLQLALGFDQPFDNSIKQIYHPSQSDRSWTTMPPLEKVVASPFCSFDAYTADDSRKNGPTPDRLAIRLDGERGITTHGIEPFDRWLPMTVVISLRETKRSALRSLIAHHTRGTDCGYNGWDLTIEDGYLESRMARVWPGNAISVRTTEPIASDRWHQVAATYDGSSSAKGLKLFLNGEELDVKIVRNSLKKSCNVSVDHGGEFVVGQRFRARGLDGGLIDDVRVYGRALTLFELRRLAKPEGNEEHLAERPSFQYFASAIDEASRTALADLTAKRKSFVMAEEVANEIPIMEELKSPRTTHVLLRGEYDAPKDSGTLVGRSTLSALPIEFPSDKPNDRLGLAHWVTDPEHPLTARVAVNRFWGNFFPHGLVRTPENFGAQGELPTHPRLLDWLARDFVSSGWDVKRLCKSIVLSATYRQDSSADAESLAVDPTNKWLARGPAYRLGAEQIRDLALASSGLLNPMVGGAPVSPYQPGQDLWKESNGMSPPYQQSVGRSLYRRSLYSVWKRTAPLPNMLAFDATTREVCTVKRSRTNTPLQALVLLNDVQFVEAARVLGAQLMEQPVEERITVAFLKLTGRRPDEVESRTLEELLISEREFYREHEDAAKQLLAIGGTKFDGAQVDSAEVAALTNVCQAILNLDATVWKR